MNTYILELLGTLLGLILGGVMGYYLSRRKSKDEFRASLFAEYRKIAQELATILKDVLQLSLIPEKITAEKCNEIDKALGDFVFKYFLVLPQDVLQEINCLHVCLVCGGTKTFVVKKMKGKPVLLPRATDRDVKNLLDGVALVTTKKSLFDIYKEYGKLPKSVLLKCQARHVMVVMNNKWKPSKIYKWERILPKKTLDRRY